MPKQYRLSIRGNQREEIDEDLLAEALLMVAEDLEHAQEADQDDKQQPSTSDEDEQ
jgi:hypothetical protein